MSVDIEERQKHLDCAYKLRQKIMKKMENAVDKNDIDAADAWGRILSLISF